MGSPLAEVRFLFYSEQSCYLKLKSTNQWVVRDKGVLVSYYTHIETKTRTLFLQLQKQTPKKRRATKQ